MCIRDSPGVEDGIDGIDHDIGDDDEGGGDQHDPLDDRQILAADGAHHVLPQSRQAEDGLRDDGAAEDAGQVDPELGHDRGDRGPERVAVDDPPLREPLGPSGADVVLPQDLEERAAREPGVGGRGDQGQGQPGEEQVAGPLRGIGEERREVARARRCV